MNKTFSLSRRSFLEVTGAAAVGAAVAGATSELSLPAAGADTPKWPVTCRDQHLKATGQTDCWAAMKFLEVDGAEVQVNEELACYSLYHPEEKYTLATDAGIQQVKESFHEHGKVISSFCMHNKLDQRLDQEVEWTRKLVKAAQALKVDVIRIDVVPGKTPADQFLPFAIEACKKLCQTAEGGAVRFGVENHSKITNDPDFLDKLFAGVGSPKLGLTMDCMNFYWWGHPLDKLYGIIERVAPRAFHTHCKNLKYPDDKKNAQRPMGWEYSQYSAALYDGDIDYKKVAAILRKAGYQGDLCLENECLHHFPQEQHPEVLKKEVQWLRAIA
ncbi:MAG: sugar phosphate isomerase/epimerase [Candidatus Sumerlaeota bacterium]|nr:sugar phosphate isomerase/epimerase [Candidatus Sumerlaeota bacterium]